MRKNWREGLPVHPAADMFRMMSEAKLRELGEDIRKNKLQIPIVLWARDAKQKGLNRYSLLDGRNRLDAMEIAGHNPRPFRARRKRGRMKRQRPKRGH